MPTKSKQMVCLHLHSYTGHTTRQQAQYHKSLTHKIISFNMCPLLTIEPYKYYTITITQTIFGGWLMESIPIQNPLSQ